MTTLAWFHAPPTEPGWYWHRSLGGGPPMKPPLLVVDVDGVLCVSFRDEADWHPVSKLAPWEWAGPIPMPADAG